MLVANQIYGFIKKQKKLIKMAKSEEEQLEAFGLWCGFLNGMRMTGAISKKEYEELYKEMIAFSRQIAA